MDKKTQQAVEVITKSLCSLVDFRRLMLERDNKEVAPASFHERWSDILLNAKESFAIEGFRQSSKTTYVTRAFPLHCLTFPNQSRRYILIIMANTTLANKKLKEVSREFLRNKFANQNVLEIIENSGDALEVRFKTLKEISPTEQISVRIEAYGKGSSVRGALWGTKRPDVVVIEDCQDEATLKSETTLENDWDWFLDDIMFLGDETRVFMIGNNLGPKCILERIAREEGNFGFRFERVPICHDLEGDSTTWPEMFNMEDVRKQRDQYQKTGKLSIWYRNKMCVCIADEDREFKKEKFQYYPISETERIASKCNVYLRCDPAVKVEQANDYSAFVICGINEDNHWFVFDCVYGKMKQSEKVDAVFNLVKRWKPKNVGIENSKEGLILIQDLRDQMPRRNQFFRLVEVKHGNIKKEVRISAMQPRFEAESVHFPDTAQWLAEMEAELTMFSKHGQTTVHDDLIDALAYMNMETQEPITQVNMWNAEKFRNLPRQGKITCRAS